MAIHGLVEESPIQRAKDRQITPITALVKGPTSAIQNSTFALAGFFSICETPPSAKRVISLTGSLFDVATKECASSCSSSEMKNRMAVPTARIRMTPLPHAGLLAWNCEESENTMRRAIRNQL